MKIKICNVLVAAVLGSDLAAPGNTAISQTPESYRKLWADPALTQRIERNIEKHRKYEEAFAGAKTQEFQIDLAKDGQATHQLTLKNQEK